MVCGFTLTEHMTPPDEVWVIVIPHTVSPMYRCSVYIPHNKKQKTSSISGINALLIEGKRL